MASDNRYDVTSWPVGDPYEDLGEVINSILADVKARQKSTDVDDGGKPGAVIYLPPGDYRLRTQVRIDISQMDRGREIVVWAIASPVGVSRRCRLLMVELSGMPTATGGTMRVTRASMTNSRPARVRNRVMA